MRPLPSTSAPMLHTSTLKPTATNSTAMPNLRGMDGFMPRASSLGHAQANSGASRMMNTGLADWNSVKSNGVSTWSLAKKFSDEPACSNMPQNNILARNSSSIAMYRCSCTLSPLRTPATMKYTVSTRNMPPSSHATSDFWLSSRYTSGTATSAPSTTTSTRAAPLPSAGAWPIEPMRAMRHWNTASPISMPMPAVKKPHS